MKQLQHFRGNEEFARRMYDIIDQMQRYQKTIVTPFLTPEETAIVQMICGKHILYATYGGYEGAERVKVACIPYADEHIDYAITCLKASYTTDFTTITHRDVLGAIMHIGLVRDAIGDIIVDQGDIFIFCDQTKENYISCNLTKIKHSNVHFMRYEESLTYQQSCVYETKIVSSLRLDVLVSTLAHVSRGKAAQLIKAGLVKVNHVVLDQTAYLCNNNSAISIRGIGRFQYLQVIKRTKKDHLVIEIARYT